MKRFYILQLLLIVLLIAGKSTNSLGQQNVQVQNDNSLNMSSLGSAWSTNLWSNSYIGFNLKRTGPWNSSWATFSDGANNGAGGIIGGINGSLLFLTAPTSGASSGQTFQDADMPAMVRMSLNGTGQLRIGAKAAIGIHSDYKLSVYGKLTAVSLYVLADNATNWADYVFADEYKLMPLPDLERYIGVNHHLPDMPTTRDVEINGINVAAMNALLLKKVEELTLHLIEVSKEVQQLRANQAGSCK